MRKILFVVTLVFGFSQLLISMDKFPVEEILGIGFDKAMQVRALRIELETHGLIKEREYSNIILATDYKKLAAEREKLEADVKVKFEEAKRRTITQCIAELPYALTGIADDEQTACTLDELIKYKAQLTTEEERILDDFEKKSAVIDTKLAPVADAVEQIKKIREITEKNRSECEKYYDAIEKLKEQALQNIQSNNFDIEAFIKSHDEEYKKVVSKLVKS